MREVELGLVSTDPSSHALRPFLGSRISAANVRLLWDVEGSILDRGYRLPPSDIKDIVDAPPLPALSFSPLRDKILFLKSRALPSLAELAKPEEKLAGIRIDGKCNPRSRMSFYTGIGIHQLLPNDAKGPEIEVHGFPEGAKLNFVTWSSDGKHLAFSVRVDEEGTDSGKTCPKVVIMKMSFSEGPSTESSQD